MAFLDENYLLESETAKKLYEEVKNLPILDAHNHGDVKEILDNEGWSDIWEVEAATDHYVWELMRKRGVSEDKITGDASNKEKWMALAKVFPEFAGNPTYEWIHLDLKRRFGIEEVISEHTAEMIWEKTKARLADDDMKPQRILKDMNVQIMCTTDEPYSKLEEHQQAKEEVEGVKILPTWRPDKIMNIDQAIWKESVEKLAEATEQKVDTFEGLLVALQKSHDFFEEMGCVASDHGIVEPISYFVEESRASDIYEKALSGEELSEEEIRDYKAFMLVKFGKMNEASNWVTQLHIGAVRDYRDSLYETLGADVGGDISTSNIEIAENLKYFVNEFDNSLKIVLYTMESTHWSTVATISRAFPNISLGSAWWLTDSPYGMEEQLRYVGTVDLLNNHAGMVSDSRKLMSYDSRNEMFRRTLSNVIGKMVDKGQMPYQVAADLVANVSYYRPLNLFFK
ncbi:D-glucuronate isomerase [Orenia metallireducens]|uniref:Uronate isomerase n=1 Tax=Orenia metallireducens TaxID=1413210 RepID=A0A285G862_9FIRM|nr:glucuronate isomerase [Orenia metallireducens]PRX28281.1 D-glucuronate isomerase [Orenia metallireducens]SNY19533.1 D-glucuronate isomerase [Orenia metallireducens]